MTAEPTRAKLSGVVPRGRPPGRVWVVVVRLRTTAPDQDRHLTQRPSHKCLKPNSLGIFWECEAPAERSESRLGGCGSLANHGGSACDVNRAVVRKRTTATQTRHNRINTYEQPRPPSEHASISKIERYTPWPESRRTFGDALTPGTILGNIPPVGPLAAESSPRASIVVGPIVARFPDDRGAISPGGRRSCPPVAPPRFWYWVPWPWG